MTRPRKTAKSSEWPNDRLARPAVGLEAELTLVVDGTPTDPEALFGSPRGFISQPLMHRTGTSYHLPNGAAVYFDTGVIEVATSAMEIERGCIARAVRSLWEAIAFVREHLDRWGRLQRRDVRLQGFSAHYNVSVESVGGLPATAARLNRLVLTLIQLLPAPVMLLATNRRSTGVGVRPRAHRVEITADFTPDPALMIATGSFIAGVIRSAMSRRPGELRRVTAAVPLFRRFEPMRHTSRRGWLARFDCFPANPFACDVDADTWATTHGPLSLRAIARRIFHTFARAIAHIADPPAMRLIASMLNDKGPSLLALEGRPSAYDDVGRMSVWTGSDVALSRSRYERVLANAIARRPLRLFGTVCTPVRVRGWSRIVFRRPDGGDVAVAVDALVDRLDEWETAGGRNAL
jgi:hypothetical protein